MAERYMFFNSTATDRRRHQASDMADYWESFLSSGLIHEGGQPQLEVVVDGTSRNVTLSIGRALLKGHLYINDADLNKVIDGPDATLDRIDRLVLRYDNTIEERSIKSFIIKGVEAENPEPPELTREGDIYEISLAQIRVVAGKSFVEQSDIIDERLDESVCGLASSLVSVPTDYFRRVFKEYMDLTESEWDEWFSRTKTDIEEIFPRDTIINMENILLELMIQRDLEDVALEYDAGYWWDLLTNEEKIESTTMNHNTSNRRLQFSFGEVAGETIWKEHEIGFVSNGINHYHERPKYSQATVAEHAYKGESVITIALGTGNFL